MAVIVVLALVSAVVARSVRHEARTVHEPPDGAAIARNLSSFWLWPDDGSGIAADTREHVTSAFATKVLGLSKFTVTTPPGDPIGMQIDTPALHLSLVTNHLPGGTSPWVIYELGSPALSFSDAGLVAISPPGAATADLYVRYMNSARSFRLTVNGTGTVVLPLSDAVIAAVVVFRNANGAVIDAASVDAETVTTRTTITCTFHSGGETTTATLQAEPGATASTGIGAQTAQVDVIAGSRPGTTGIRVRISGGFGTDGFGTHDLTRASGTVSQGGNGSATFACNAQNPPQAITDPAGQAGPRFVH